LRANELRDAPEKLARNNKQGLAGLPRSHNMQSV
jgi:hypothetical protein